MWLSTLHSQHCLVMAQKLIRCLEPWEVVHHLNTVRSDTRFENLELLPKQSTHLPYALSENENKRLTKEAEDLKSQMRLPIGHIMQLRYGNPETNSEQSDKCPR
jgi:hypothetical protein